MEQVDIGIVYQAGRVEEEEGVKRCDQSDAASLSSTQNLEGISCIAVCIPDILFEDSMIEGAPCIRY